MGSVAISEQLNLGILPPIVYRAEHFVLHSGVFETFKLAESLLQRDNFSALCIEGGKRSGKTHLSIALATRLANNGLYPKIWSGKGCAEAIDNLGISESVSSGDVVVLDDAQEYFSGPQFNGSGSFVALFERLRVGGSKILILVDRPISEIMVDDHIMSRLRSMSGATISSPSQDDMPALIRAMCRQRGVNLTGTKISFLAKRLGRRISALEDYLDRLVYLSSVLGKKIDYTLLEEAI